MNTLNDGWLMDSYTKPTNHKQVCQHCGKSIEKDEQVVKVLANMYYNYPRYIYFHYSCYLYCIIKTFKGDLKGSRKIMDKIMVDNL